MTWEEHGWEEQGRQRVREEAERLSANIAKGKDAKGTEDGMGKDDKSKDGKDGASSYWNGCEVHQSKLQSCPKMLGHRPPARHNRSRCA